MSRMKEAENIVRLRLLCVIDDREHAEMAIAARLRQGVTLAAWCPQEWPLAVYAPLFDRAAAFWRGLGEAVDDGKALTRDQEYAVKLLRKPIEADVLAELKRTGAAA